ncbi:MAG TPA: hypothetical protein VHW94_07595 [Candidatus Dormibacteraeota bacterium]|jgi:hypothetical protein|nr:hypothetical protein [Candidatus Dormibacteraeota bacterium]
MEDLGPVTDDHVILAWLQAEIESPPFQAYLVGDPPKPSHLARALALARNPDTGNDAHNAERRRIIASAHGFGRGALIFAGLEDDIVWRRAQVSVAEVSEMLYSNRNATWTTLAPATRKVAEGASNATRLFTGDDMNLHILSLARIICHAANPETELSDLICLRVPDGSISLLEGHTRATAIVMEGHKLPNGVRAFIGDSPSIKSWAYL